MPSTTQGFPRSSCVRERLTGRPLSTNSRRNDLTCRWQQISRLHLSSLERRGLVVLPVGAHAVEQKRVRGDSIDQWPIAVGVDRNGRQPGWNKVSQVRGRFSVLRLVASYS